MKLSNLSTLLVLSVFLTSCTSGYKTVVGNETYAAVPEKSVAVLLAFPPEGTYKPIGVVHSRGAALASDDAVYRKFRKAAADMGADAVIVGQEATNFRGFLPGHANTTGSVDIYRNGSSNYYSGDYSGTTTYTPPTPMYGLDVRGIAIRYTQRASNTASP